MSEPDDVALLVGASENAERLAVLRKRGERVDAAVLSRAREGQPVHGDLVELSPRDEPLLFDVKTVYKASDRTSGGPAQVASASYREGWDRVFAGRRRRGRGPAVN